LGLRTGGWWLLARQGLEFPAEQGEGSVSVDISYLNSLHWLKDIRFSVGRYPC